MSVRPVATWKATSARKKTSTVFAGSGRRSKRGMTPHRKTTPSHSDRPLRSHHPKQTRTGICQGNSEENKDPMNHKRGNRFTGAWRFLTITRILIKYGLADITARLFRKNRMAGETPEA